MISGGPKPGGSSVRLSRIVLDGIDCAVLSMPVTSGAAGLGRLTPAEREVAAAIVRGETNAAIARDRGTSPRTVANQIASILRKTGCPSRAGLAAMADSGIGSCERESE